MAAAMSSVRRAATISGDRSAPAHHDERPDGDVLEGFSILRMPLSENRLLVGKPASIFPRHALAALPTSRARAQHRAEIARRGLCRHCRNGCLLLNGTADIPSRAKAK